MKPIFWNVMIGPTSREDLGLVQGFHCHSITTCVQPALDRASGGLQVRGLPEDTASLTAGVSMESLKTCGRVSPPTFLLGSALALVCKGSQKWGWGIENAS